jgi:diguanylate cyclase (GGDEF)-like protein
MTHPMPPSAVDAVLADALRALTDRLGSPWLVTDERGRCIAANQAFAALAGRPLDQLIGLAESEIFDAGIATMLRAADLAARTQAQRGAGALTSDHSFEWAGRRREYAVTRIAAGSLLASVWLDQGDARARDQQLRSALDQLEQQQRANDSLRRELKDQVVRDPASGLQIKTHFEDQLRREVDLSSREHREFALVQIEVDAAGEAVAALGPAAQQRIHEAMGRLLRGNTRAMDASCRIEDGRFAVLLSGVGLATAHARMEGLRRQCATQIVMYESRELRFTVSMGVASFPHTAHSQADLVAACEGALAEARRRGGNHVTLASIRFDSVA